MANIKYKLYGKLAKYFTSKLNPSEDAGDKPRELPPHIAQIASDLMPEHFVLKNFVTWHLLKIIETSQKEEAEFHWRMVRYYTRATHELFPDIEWLSERESYMKMKEAGKSPHLIEAIDKYDLLNLPEY